MRKQKTIKSVVAMMAAAMTLTQPVAAASWVKNDTGWQWHEDNGSYAANKWNHIRLFRKHPYLIIYKNEKASVYRHSYNLI